MKKVLLIFGAPVIGIVLISSVLRTSGSPGGYSGSPGDGKDCTSCHSGTSTNKTGWITSDIPSSGYIPGNTYTITGTITHTGMIKAGFEITSEEAGNAKEGTYTITNGTETQLLNSTAFTHTSGGVTPSNNSKSWSCSWTAPIAGTGTITFYGSFLAGNGSGSSGDTNYLSSLSVNEDTSTDIDNNKANVSSLMFINESKELIYSADQSGYIKIYGLNGKLIKSSFVEATTNGRFNLGNLPGGYYIVALVNNDKTLTQIKVIID